VKNLKFGVLLFGALGVIGLLVLGWTAMLEADKAQAILVMAGFVVPLVMGIMGVTKPPFQKWQAAVAAAGFALIFVKMRMWDILPHIADVMKFFGAGMLMVIIACVAGLIVSILAIVKSEEA
jgi:hypothetical protein